jgi:peptidoglycan/LPS O-acetylase OafA/YrhL
VAWETERAVPRSRIGVMLGAASYSIYLLHGMVLGAVSRIIPHQSFGWFTLGALVGTIVVGVAFYVAVERPMTDALRELIRSRHKRWPRTFGGRPGGNLRTKSVDLAASLTGSARMRKTAR